jgi:RNA polymerase sigma-70 factor (ECF subfamily)
VKIMAMATLSAHTTQLHNWMQRMRAGDRSAQEELLRSLGDRLERLARKMLKGFPGVRRWEQTLDVLQNALLRLLRSLQEVEPASMREFFGLAAQQMRRELLDLARHHYGPQRPGAHHASHHAGAGVDACEPPADADAPEELERWSAFHEAVDRLPAEEREVIGLVFYHGWTQAEVAELFQVTVRTVQRRWQSALLRLHGILKDGDWKIV